MKTKTLRGRVALWTVAVVSGALIIFGAGTAWNLRRELIENLDKEIKTEATDLLSELHEGKVAHGACMHERDFGQLAFFVEALVIVTPPLGAFMVALSANLLFPSLALFSYDGAWSRVLLL